MSLEDKVQVWREEGKRVAVQEARARVFKLLSTLDEIERTMLADLESEEHLRVNSYRPPNYGKLIGEVPDDSSHA